MTSDERGLPDPASDPGLSQAGRAPEHFVGCAQPGRGARWWALLVRL